MKIGAFNGIDQDGVYTHPNSDTAEKTLIEILADDDQWLASPINIDAVNLTVQTTFRLYMKVDGTNYRQRYGVGSVGGTIVWNPGDSPWVSFMLSGIFDHDVKVTMQSGGSGEPVSADVPWSYNAAR